MTTETGTAVAEAALAHAVKNATVGFAKAVITGVVRAEPQPAALLDRAGANSGSAAMAAS